MFTFEGGQVVEDVFKKIAIIIIRCINILQSYNFVLCFDVDCDKSSLGLKQDANPCSRTCKTAG